MKYFVTLAGHEHVVEIDGERVTVDGEAMEAHLVPVPGTPLRQLLTGDRPLVLPLEHDRTTGRWTLTLHGERMEAEAVDERTRHIRSLIGEGAKKTATGTVRAPMPGMVVRVLISQGDYVRAGQGLAVLEAMKMENELKAPADGVVRTVHVVPGAVVEKGQALVEVGEGGEGEAGSGERASP